MLEEEGDACGEPLVAEVAEPIGGPGSRAGAAFAADDNRKVVFTLRTAATNLRRMETTLDYAEAHFAQLLGLVANGEEVVVRRGTVAVARIVPIPPVSAARPRVGEVTSAPVRWSEATFAPVDEDGMKELGLL